MQTPPHTNFWLIRHALVAPDAQTILYGRLDVSLCQATLAAPAPASRRRARRLPLSARWVVTPLSRTRATAEAIFAAGYPATPPVVEPDLTEQSLGDWQGLAHADLPAKLANPAHAFWPLAGAEQPPGGESMEQVIGRVGPAMERLAADNRGGDVVLIGHGGAIRASIAHALGIGADNALHLSVQNLSLTRLERHVEGWRVVSVNEPAQTEPHP